MDERTLADIERRLARLEAESVRLRRGLVTQTDPLAVALGGSDVAYADVRTTSGAPFAVGDAICALVRAGELIVLGRIA